MKKDKVRILVVDDEEIVRESLSGWLAKDGYSMDVAEDGPSALAKLKQGPWSILLVDLKMPGMDGLQLLEEVKQRDPATAVVIMTAYATVDTAVRAIKLGAWDYIVKPFDPEELSLMIQKIAEQQALVRENALLRKVVRKEYHFRDLESRNPAMRAVFELARTAAASSSTILVLARAAPARSCWRAPSTPRARARGGRSCRSRAPRSPRRCSSRSCSATRRGPSPGR